jgi:two-component system cell cycle response regulator
LRHHQYDTLVANGGQSALDYLKTHIPDLVLLDIKMPQVDGFAVCKYIKTTDSLMHVPVVMVSAVNDFRDQQYATEIGADAFIVKPVSVSKLLDLLTRFLG